MNPFRALFRDPTLSLFALLAASVSTAAQSIPGSPLPIRQAKPTPVWVVDDTPVACRSSADIQSALIAAAEGDVILVKSGDYPSFTIDRKSVCLVGEGRPVIRCLIRNLRANQRVVLRGFQFNSVTVRDCSGPIWAEDCVFNGNWPVQSSAVGFFRCQFVGGLSTVGSSTVFDYHSTFRGSQGGDAYFDSSLCSSSGGFECDWHTGGSGASGLALNAGSGAWLFGTSLVGGNGGSPLVVSCDCYNGGPRSGDLLSGGCGGHALTLPSGASALVLQSSLSSGLPDCDGHVVIGSGTLETVSGTTGLYWVDSPIGQGDPLHYRVEGPAGRKVFLSVSSQYTPSYEPLLKGFRVVHPETPDTFLGTIPASGVLDVTQSFGYLLRPWEAARVLFTQINLYNESNGAVILGTPSALVVLRDPCP